MRRLLVVSHMAHYRRGDHVVGWGPTADEISQVAALFDEVHHIAFLHDKPAPDSSVAYTTERVNLVPVHPSGGDSVCAKLRILRYLPQYVYTIWREMKSADVIHVRCPANISLIAIILLYANPSTAIRWVKYAGNWSPDAPEPWSYRFQRWWLRRNFVRGLITVNGSWEHQPAHVVSLKNPSLTSTDLELARNAASGKVLTQPIHVVFVGRVEAEKGAGRVLEILAGLRRVNIEARLDLFGDGPQRPIYEAMARRLGVADVCKFHGWQARQTVFLTFAHSHFAILPTISSEGWPKALSEAMAFGNVPLAGNVSSIPQLLAHYDTGHAIHALNTQAYVETIVNYLAHPQIWKNESNRACTAASDFGFGRYVDAVRELLHPRMTNCRY